MQTTKVKNNTKNSLSICFNVIDKTVIYLIQMWHKIPSEVSAFLFVKLQTHKTNQPLSLILSPTAETSYLFGVDEYHAATYVIW